MTAPVQESSEIYHVVGEVELRMHFVLPAGEAASPRAGMVFFFGGGWTNGTAAHFLPQARHLAALGMVAACAEYRIASKHGTSPFDAVRDAKAAVRWMRRNAKRFGIDSDKIGGGGGSAGGHLAACCAMIPGFEEETEEIRSVPDALVLFNPVLDTTEKGFGQDKVTLARATEISPCHHVRQGLPPTLVMHGDADTVAPFENAERFTRDMQAADNVCRLVSYPGRGHGFFNRREMAEGVDDADFRDTLRETEAFLGEFGWISGRKHPGRTPANISMKTPTSSCL